MSVPTYSIAPIRKPPDIIGMFTDKRYLACVKSWSDYSHLNLEIRKYLQTAVTIFQEEDDARPPDAESASEAMDRIFPWLRNKALIHFDYDDTGYTLFEYGDIYVIKCCYCGFSSIEVINKKELRRYVDICLGLIAKGKADFDGDWLKWPRLSPT